MVSKKNTSWESVNRWYDKLVGDEGHYYHQSIILPGVIRLLQLKTNSSLLDLACGQGVLARLLPKEVEYLGVDLAKELIKAAKTRDKEPNHQYEVGDISKPLPTEKKDFSHAAIILALQNIETPEKVIAIASNHLKKGARFIIVLNHPYFRIPRQTCWGIDDTQKLQYRRVNRYMTPLKIPIQHNPSKGKESSTTWSFHHPLSSYCQWLHQCDFSIENIEEWCSDKISMGSAAKMENRSREEFPLFMTLSAIKLR